MNSTEVEMKKLYQALLLIAAGLLICTVNIYINFGKITVNVTPTWLGYLLLFFGLQKLDSRRYRWLPYYVLILAAGDIFSWIIGFTGFTFNGSYLEIVLSVLYVVFVCCLMSAVIDVARSLKSENVSKLKIVRLILMLTGIISTALIVLAALDERFAFVYMLNGVIGLIAYAVSVAVLYMFYKEMKERE